MPAVSTSILVGSIVLPEQSFTVSGNPASVAAGTYYLRHTTAALSLIEVFGAAITAAGGDFQQIFVTRSRQVRIEINAPDTVDWGSATALRDILGFTANLSSGFTTAAEISPLLWSPGYPGTPSTIPGVRGYPVDHKTQFKSDDGSQLHTDFYSEEEWQELEWSHIVPSRLRSTSGTGGGTFHEFYKQCARLGERFQHHEFVTEDTGDASTAMTFGTALGPYVLREFSGDYYRRRVQGADVSSPLKLPLHVVDEVA